MTEIYLGDYLERIDLGDSVIAITIQKIEIGNLKARSVNRTNQFTVPRTEVNDEIFGWAFEEHSRTVVPYRVLAGKIVQNGIEYQGKFIVKSFEDGYRLNFLEQLWNCFQSVDGLTMADIAPITASPWDEPGQDDARDNTEGIISAIINWGRSGGIYYSNFFLPSFFYHTLIKEIFEYTGVTVSGDILTDARFTDLVVPFPYDEFSPPGAVDAPTYEGKGAVGSGTGSSITFTYPTVTANDMLFLHVMSYGLGTITVDASWTSLGSLVQPTSSPVFVSKLYYKKAAGTETGTEAVTRSGHSGSNSFMAQCYQYRGDAYIVVEDSDSQNGNASTITWAATSVGGNKRTLAAFVANIGADPGVPTGYTNSATDNNGGGNYLELNTKEDVSSDGSVTATGGSTGDGWVTWHVSIYNVVQNVNWNQYLLRLKCTDLLEDFFTRFGIIPKQERNTLTLKTIEAIISDRPNAVDWSAKKVLSKPIIDFKSDLAQINNFDYSDQVNDDTLGRGVLSVDDTTLPLEKTAFSSIFENVITESTYGYIVATIAVYDSTSDAGGDMVDDPGIRLLTLKSRTTETAITFDQTARTDYKLAYFVDATQAKDTGFTYFLNQFYPQYSAALQKYKVITKLFYLNDLDVKGYDPHKLIYDGDGYYIVNKISNFVPGKITKVELFKVSL